MLILFQFIPGSSFSTKFIAPKYHFPTSVHDFWLDSVPCYYGIAHWNSTEVEIKVPSTFSVYHAIYLVILSFKQLSLFVSSPCLPIWSGNCSVIFQNLSGSSASGPSIKYLLLPNWEQSDLIIDIFSFLPPTSGWLLQLFRDTDTLVAVADLAVS